MGSLLYIITAIFVVWFAGRLYSRKYIKLAHKASSNRWQTFMGLGKLLKRHEILSYLFGYAKQYGRNCVYWMGPLPLFLTTEPQILKEILTSKNCINKPLILYNGFTAVAGEGIITDSDSTWIQHRKILNKVFSQHNLMSFLHIFNEETDSLIEKLQKTLDQGKAIDLLTLFRELTVRNATKTLLKRNLEKTEFNSTKLSEHIQRILEYVANITFQPIMIFSWFRKITENFMDKSIKESVYTFQKLMDKPFDILSKTKDPNNCEDFNITVDNSTMQDHVGHLFLGASETTSGVIYFAVFLLAMHTKCQERAYEEIMNVIPDTEDNDITWQHLNQLLYLDMILNETMRVLPVIPMIFRKVSKDDLKLSNGLILPVGQCIAIDIYHLHRSKDVWGPNAENFNPDNFLKENVATRHPYSFIPFTKGSRYCIGWKYATLSVKIALIKLIRAYKFTTDFKYSDLKVENNISLKLVEDPRINLEQRKPSSD